jgi:hypothetical protein
VGRPVDHWRSTLQGRACVVGLHLFVCVGRIGGIKASAKQAATMNERIMNCV